MVETILKWEGWKVKLCWTG